MACSSELTEQLLSLVEAGLWSQAILHLRQVVEQVGSRSEAHKLRAPLEYFPPEAWSLPGGPRALAWVAYRAGDAVLLEGVLWTAPEILAAFEAFWAGLERRWEEVLSWAGWALPGAPAGEATRAARCRASAARDAYAQALPELRRALWGFTLTQANQGITCLKLNLFPAAERALVDCRARRCRSSTALGHACRCWGRRTFGNTGCGNCRQRRCRGRGV